MNEQNKQNKQKKNEKESSETHPWCTSSSFSSSFNAMRELLLPFTLRAPCADVLRALFDDGGEFKRSFHALRGDEQVVVCGWFGGDRGVANRMSYFTMVDRDSNGQVSERTKCIEVERRQQTASTGDFVVESSG